MLGLAAGRVAGDVSPLHWLVTVAEVLRRWRAAEGQLNARIDAAAQRRRDAEERLAALSARPAPLLGSRDASALASEVGRLEAALDSARREEAEARRHHPGRDLLAEFRERAPAMLPAVLARAVALAERKAKGVLNEMRGGALAALAAIDEATEAHRLAEEIAGQSFDAPTVLLRGRDVLEDIARGV